jgi:hypothetical protein
MGRALEVPILSHGGYAMAVSRHQPAKLITLWSAFLIFFSFFVTIAQAAQVTLALDPLEQEAEGIAFFSGSLERIMIINSLYGLVWIQPVLSII